MHVSSDSLQNSIINPHKRHNGCARCTSACWLAISSYENNSFDRIASTAPAVSTKQPNDAKVVWSRALANISSASCMQPSSSTLTPETATSRTGASSAVSIAVRPITSEKKSIAEP